MTTYFLCGWSSTQSPPFTRWQPLLQPNCAHDSTWILKRIKQLLPGQWRGVAKVKGHNRLGHVHYHTSKVLLQKSTPTKMTLCTRPKLCLFVMECFELWSYLEVFRVNFLSLISLPLFLLTTPYLHRFVHMYGYFGLWILMQVPLLAYHQSLLGSFLKLSRWWKQISSYINF